MSMGITHLSVPSWLALSRPFKMRPNRPPMPPLKPNPTRHHKDLPPWCFKTHYQSKDWWQPHPLPNPTPTLRGTSHSRNKCSPPASHDD